MNMKLFKEFNYVIYNLKKRISNIYMQGRI